MIRWLLNTCILLLFLTVNLPVKAQEERYHNLILKTDQLSSAEFNQFKTELQNQLGFHTNKACLDEGFILVEVPVSMGIRVHHAQESALAIAKSLLGNATLDHEFSVNDIIQCAE